MDGLGMSDLTLISADILAQLMPMSLTVSASGVIRHAGPTLTKLVDGKPLSGRRFFDLFDVQKPRTIFRVADFAALYGQKLQVVVRGEVETPLRGLAVPLIDERTCLLNFSFGIAVADAVQVEVHAAQAHDLVDEDPKPDARGGDGAGQLEVEAHDQQRRQRERDAGGQRLTGRAGGLRDVVLEDRPAQLEPAEQRDREDGDRDRRRHRQADLEAEVRRRRGEDHAEHRAHHHRRDGQLGDGLVGWDERFVFGS